MTAAEQHPAAATQRPARDASRAQAQEPSLNVQSLQRRASGVLPVRIDVPRAGTHTAFSNRSSSTRKRWCSSGIAGDEMVSSIGQVDSDC